MNELVTGRKRDVSSLMSLSLGLWLCCLPLVFLIVAPFFGWKAAGAVALVVFGILVVVCFGICTTKVYKEGGERHA